MAVPVLVHLALIHGRTGARVPSQLPPLTKPVRSRAEGKVCPPGVLADADRSAYLSGRSLLRVSPAGVLVSLRRRFTCGSCLYPAVTAVAFYSRTNNDAHRCRLRVGREAARVGSAPHANWQSGSNLAETRVVVLAARWRRSEM